MGRPRPRRCSAASARHTKARSRCAHLVESVVGGGSSGPHMHPACSAARRRRSGRLVAPKPGPPWRSLHAPNRDIGEPPICSIADTRHRPINSMEHMGHPPICSISQVTSRRHREKSGADCVDLTRAFRERAAATALSQKLSFVPAVFGGARAANTGGPGSAVLEAGERPVLERPLGRTGAVRGGVVPAHGRPAWRRIWETALPSCAVLERGRRHPFRQVRRDLRRRRSGLEPWWHDLIGRSVPASSQKADPGAASVATPAALRSHSDAADHEGPSTPYWSFSSNCAPASPVATAEARADTGAASSSRGSGHLGAVESLLESRRPGHWMAKALESRRLVSVLEPVGSGSQASREAAAAGARAVTGVGNGGRRASAQRPFELMADAPRTNTGDVSASSGMPSAARYLATVAPTGARTGGGARCPGDARRRGWKAPPIRVLETSAAASKVPARAPASGPRSILVARTGGVGSASPPSARCVTGALRASTGASPVAWASTAGRRTRPDRSRYWRPYWRWRRGSIRRCRGVRICGRMCVREVLEGPIEGSRGGGDRPSGAITGGRGAARGPCPAHMVTTYWRMTR